MSGDKSTVSPQETVKHRRVKVAPVVVIEVILAALFVAILAPALGPPPGRNGFGPAVVASMVATIGVLVFLFAFDESEPEPDGGDAE